MSLSSKSLLTDPLQLLVVEEREEIMYCCGNPYIHHLDVIYNTCLLLRITLITRRDRITPSLNTVRFLYLRLLYPEP